MPKLNRMVRTHPGLFERPEPNKHLRMVLIKHDVQGLIAHAAVTDNEEALALCRGFYKLCERLEAKMDRRRRKAA